MIRETTEGDVETLVEIAASTGVFRPPEIEALRVVFDDYFEVISGVDHRCKTLLIDNRPQGFVYYAFDEMTDGAWEIWWIVTRPNLQGRGHGSKLLEYAESDIVKAGGRVIFVDTSSTPLYEATNQFYLRRGYQKEAVLRSYYAPGDDKVMFRKDLSR